VHQRHPPPPAPICVHQSAHTQHTHTHTRCHIKKGKFHKPFLVTWKDWTAYPPSPSCIFLLHLSCSEQFSCWVKMAFLGFYKGLLANRGGGEIAATSMYPLIYPDERLFIHAEPNFYTPRFAIRNLTKTSTGGKRLSTWSLGGNKAIATTLR